MNDKPVAAILTALAVVPIVVMCCLGPVVLGSAVLGGIAGWLAGWGALEIVIATLGVAAVSCAVFGLARARRDRAAVSEPSRLATRGACSPDRANAAVALPDEIPAAE